jgi:hypothetical protein
MNMDMEYATNNEWYRQYRAFLYSVIKNAWSRRDPRVLAARHPRTSRNEVLAIQALWKAHHVFYGVPEAWWNLEWSEKHRNHGGMAGTMTQGRCRSCDISIRWVPSCCSVKLVRDAYCPRCGTKLDRTTYDAKVSDVIYAAPVAKPREVA